MYIDLLFPDEYHHTYDYADLICNQNTSEREFFQLLLRKHAFQSLPENQFNFGELPG